MHTHRGQAMLELLIVASFVLVPMIFMVAYLGKTGDIQHRAYESARYAVWEAATTTKSPVQINYELGRRLMSQEFTGLDSIHDRTATGTQNVAPAPLYFHTREDGSYATLLQKRSQTFAQQSLINRTPEGNSYALRKDLLGNALVDFNLEQSGLIDANVDYQIETDRSLPQIGSLSPAANNAMYTQNWRHVTHSSLAQSLDDAVFGERAFNDSVFDKLAQLASKVGFEEWDDFEPGIIEPDVVPCSRVINGGSNRELACE